MSARPPPAEAATAAPAPRAQARQLSPRPRRTLPRTFYEAVYAVVAEVPHGRVVTYGAVATWLGSPRAARAVGYALAADAAGPLPWQRVVNAAGGISIGGAPWRPEEQLRRLRAEQVPFVGSDHVDLCAAKLRPSKAQYRRWLALGDYLRRRRGAQT